MLDHTVDRRGPAEASTIASPVDAPAPPIAAGDSPPPQGRYGGLADAVTAISAAHAGLVDTVVSPARAAAPSGPADQDERLAVGGRIGRYLVLSRIGQGGMGEVLSGYDAELDRRVALKVVRGRVDGSQGQARMKREAQALARLSHPNVVQVHDVGEHAGQVFLAMEFVKGVTLREWQEDRERATPAGQRAIIDMYLQAGRGLAAAHQAGIVHRDFKPDNVLVGDDGRARVLDFGLAAERDAADEGVAAGGGRLEALTLVGSILGTPAYMAPEQFLAAPTDTRTDVFSFAVALYGALYGESPFDGATLIAREQAVLRGEVRPAPPGSRVPPWLRAVLLRGLARDPVGRYASMEEFIRALTDDPIALRRRRWRLLGLGAASVAIAAAMIAGLQIGWRALQRRQAETAASERLAAATARIDELRAAGDDAEAERVFASFLELPENRGTAALGEAWLRRAAQARARGNAAEALDAFAAAYTVSASDEAQAEAMVGLARALRDEMQWAGVVQALASIDARQGGAADSPELAEIRLDAELGRRGFAAAAALLRGPLAGSPRARARAVLEALQAATPTPHRHHGAAVLADLDGDGAAEVLLADYASDGQSAKILRADPGLTALGDFPVAVWTFQALSRGAGESALVVSSASAETAGALTSAAATLRRWQGGSMVEVLRWPEGQVLSTLSADLDGDGARELLVGSGPYTRRVVEVVAGGDGSWTVAAEPPAPAIDARRSDVVDLLADDLDGDGRVEVIAALGPWNAYEVQVLRHDPALGQLGMVSRRRLGAVTGAALLVDGERREVVVSKVDMYPSTAVFPRDRPYGEAAGIYFLRLEGDSLVTSSFLPAPRLADGSRVYDRRPLVGDLDGDGHAEVIVGRGLAGAETSVERNVTVILTGGEGGGWTPLTIGESMPVLVHDLDGDGDDELALARMDGEAPGELWVLGAGSATMPRLEAGLAEPTASVEVADPAVARMLAQAEDLGRLGLVRQAAENLAGAADLVRETDARARAQTRAAGLFAAISDDRRAAELYQRATRAPALADRAHEGAALALLRLGRVADASAHLAAMTRSDEASAPLVEALASLAAGGSLDLDLAGPLAPVWRFAAPLSLHHDRVGERLEIDALVAGEIASAPLRWSGGAVTLEVDIDLARVEWRSGLSIGVTSGRGVNDGPLGVDVTTTGGGNEFVHEIGCVGFGRRSVARIPASSSVAAPADRLGRFILRATLVPALGESTCEVVRGSGEVLLYERVKIRATPLPTPPRLAIESTRGPNGWVEASLRGLRVRGASLDASAPSEVSASEAERLRARRLFVEGDLPGVLAALASGGGEVEDGERLVRVAALARLGRWAEAERALRTLFDAGAPTPEVRFQLLALLRVEPTVFGALLRGAVGPADLHAVMSDAFGSSVLSSRDPEACAQVAILAADIDRSTAPGDVLHVHAEAAAAVGDRAAAAASFRAAIEAFGDPRRRVEDLAPSQLEMLRATFHLELAALAIADGDLEAAKREILPYTGGRAVDLVVLDRIRAREDLRPLWPLLPE